MRLATIAAFLLASLPVMAATITNGPWELSYTDAGPQALTHQGETLIRYGGFGSYRPDWKGANFALTGLRATADRDGDAPRVTWLRSNATDGDVKLTVTLGADRVVWSLDAEVKPAGPCEFGLLAAAAPLVQANGGLTYTNGQRLNRADERPFSNHGLAETLTFERPQRTLRWDLRASAGGWQLQDWRQRPDQALRVIAVFEGGKGPVHLSAALQATTYPAAEVAARQALLDQRTRWRDTVEVPNTGFEDGPGQWQLSATGRIVDEQARTGRRCARLQVADPAKDAVYITRQIPIVPGATYTVRCQVRTENVVARPARMSSVGAGLIVEWADAQGKWLAAGEYSCGLYGTKPWTLRECRDLRAPEKAGFAVIFLAVRAAGTAWFDDLEVERVHCAVALTGPATGATLSDNRPTLTWQPDTAASRYQIDVSADPAFPAAETISGETEDETWMPPSRLKPGRWHWRVRAPGFDPSAVWSFTQHAPADRDTTRPQVTTLFGRVTRASEAFRLALTDDSGGPVSVQASLGGQALAVTAQGPTTALLRAPAGWPEGLNDVAITARDAAGNTAQQTVRLLHRPLPAEPVRILPDGTYTSGDQRIFPFGIYQVSPKAMPTVKAAGIDVVHTYEFEGSQNDVRAAAYLDAAHAAGLRVFIGFDRGNGSGRGLVQGNLEHVVQRVSALCSNPGLFCWYLFDEPEVPGQVVVPRVLIRYADTIRQLDPYHPVVVTTWGNSMARYRRSFDTHWTQAYTTPAGVVAQLAEHRGLLGPECPLTLLVHCYDQKQQAARGQGQPFDPARFQPDPDWLHAAAFAGATQHINGLWWWWYADEAKDWLTAARVPAAWQALGRTIAELRALTPVLAAPDADHRQTVKVGDGLVQVWRRTTGGETTVVAVNTSEQDLRVQVPVTGDGPAQVLFEKRQVARQAGIIEDRFTRYAVHVYRYR